MLEHGMTSRLSWPHLCVSFQWGIYLNAVHPGERL